MKLREKNNNWRGGRVIDPRGYVLIRVGTDHHLADVRGYAYEHRLIAEKKLGRRLRKDEEVHHKDENTTNNDPENLLIAKGRLEHFYHHRTGNLRLKNPGERNTTIRCKCGCGTRFKKFDKSGRFRSFVSGHNLRI